MYTSYSYIIIYYLSIFAQHSSCSSIALKDTIQTHTYTIQFIFPPNQKTCEQYPVLMKPERIQSIYIYTIYSYNISGKFAPILHTFDEYTII